MSEARCGYDLLRSVLLDPTIDLRPPTKEPRDLGFTGQSEQRYNDPARLRYSDFSMIPRRIESAYLATKGYLEGATVAP